MRSRIPENKETGIHSTWLTTFNDMMTLIMVFFVLLFTMSTMDVNKVKRFKNSLQSALGVLMEGEQTAVKVEGGQTETGGSQPDDLKPVEKTAQSTIVEEDGPPSIEEKIGVLEKDLGIAATYSKKGISLSLKEGLLFDLGRADINPQGRTALDKIGAVIKAYGNQIRVEGHTDNLPINNERFPSNWELSTARAVNVVKFFIQSVRMDPQRLSAVGYGASKPKYPNDTIENRSKNRRVAIVLGVN